jgi:glycosyltransferase involved in cell wall biosynthesis
MIGSTSVRPRVAIFQAHWRLHSSTVFSALTLANAGYSVDVFLYKVDISLPSNMLEQAGHVSVHSFEPQMLRAGQGIPGESKTIRKIMQRGAMYLFSRGRSALRRLVNESLFLLDSDTGLIPRRIIRRTAEITLRGHHYKAMIGVDKGGVIWARAIARKYPSALIYYSLELFTSDEWSTYGLWHKRMKAAEERAHKSSWATIVQDPTRGRVLLKDNKITNDMKMFYVPVSRLGERGASKSHWLQASLGFSESQIVILNYGMISDDRFTTELVKVAQSFRDSWKLVFHGWGWNLDALIQNAIKMDKKNKVRFSLKLVDVSEEASVMGSAHISLVLYSGKSDNDQLTGFSSEKLALSLQCGVPIIAFNFPTYEHIRDEGCGVLVNNIAEVPDAVQTILSDYTNFSERAVATFDRHYSFRTNFNKVVSAIDELPAVY